MKIRGMHVTSPVCVQQQKNSNATRPLPQSLLKGVTQTYICILPILKCIILYVSVHVHTISFSLSMFSPPCTSQPILLSLLSSASHAAPSFFKPLRKLLIC
uniref:Uncharacterized protein n=1 Tax=Trypanosoma congolense (strain IL3000) TaxID=1068625 RepID=G0UZU6_TRYCI|nr:hypothetical protein, unlikely [Trypanosoma congolense IL3000]